LPPWLNERTRGSAVTFAGIHDLTTSSAVTSNFTKHAVHLETASEAAITPISLTKVASSA
jgi:hypothetical protein